MKNVITIAILLVTVVVSGQTNKGTQIRNCYLENATAKFELNEAQQETLKNAYIVRKNGVNAINKKKKEGKISEDLAKTEKKANYLKFIDVLKKLTAKSEKELTTFDSSAQKECRR